MWGCELMFTFKYTHAIDADREIGPQIERLHHQQKTFQIVFFFTVVVERNFWVSSKTGTTANSSLFPKDFSAQWETENILTLSFWSNTVHIATGKLIKRCLGQMVRRLPFNY